MLGRAVTVGRPPGPGSRPGPRRTCLRCRLRGAVETTAATCPPRARAPPSKVRTPSRAELRTRRTRLLARRAHAACSVAKSAGTALPRSCNRLDRPRWRARLQARVQRAPCTQRPAPLRAPTQHPAGGAGVPVAAPLLTPRRGTVSHLQAAPPRRRAWCCGCAGRARPPLLAGHPRAATTMPTTTAPALDHRYRWHQFRLLPALGRPTPLRRGPTAPASGCSSSAATQQAGLGCSSSPPARWAATPGWRPRLWPTRRRGAACLRPQRRHTASPSSSAPKIVTLEPEHYRVAPRRWT